MSYLPFSTRLASYLTARSGVSPEKEVILTYIIEVLIINLLNVIFTLMLGWVLGVFHVTLACLLAVILFRHTAGGAHSQSPIRCAFITILVFPIMGLSATFISTINATFINGLSVIGIITILLSVIILAPVDSSAAPIISDSRRAKLKALSLLIVCLVSLVLVNLSISSWEGAREIQSGLALSMLWTSFILSKLGHRFISLIDRLNVPKVRR